MLFVLIPFGHITSVSPLALGTPTNPSELRKYTESVVQIHSFLFSGVVSLDYSVKVHAARKVAGAFTLRDARRAALAFQLQEDAQTGRKDSLQ